MADAPVPAAQSRPSHGVPLRAALPWGVQGTRLKAAQLVTGGGCESRSPPSGGRVPLCALHEVRVLLVLIGVLTWGIALSDLSLLLLTAGLGFWLIVKDGP